MDASTTFEELTEHCISNAIDVIAISDHGTIEGALEYIKTDPPVKVIIAQEILTHHGEIMGMFLNKTIPSGGSVDETLDEIKKQEGLVCIPHPFDPVRGSALDISIIHQLAEKGQIDLIEVQNARYVFASSGKKAKKFAKQYAIPASAGSDAHSADEIGRVFLKMDYFNNKVEFIESLLSSLIYGKHQSPLIHLGSTARKFKNKIMGH